MALLKAMNAWDKKAVIDTLDQVITNFTKIQEEVKSNKQYANWTAIIIQNSKKAKAELLKATTGKFRKASRGIQDAFNLLLNVSLEYTNTTLNPGILGTFCFIQNAHNDFIYFIK